MTGKWVLIREYSVRAFQWIPTEMSRPGSGTACPCIIKWRCLPSPWQLSDLERMLHANCTDQITWPRLHRVTRGAHTLGASMLCLWRCGSRGCISLIPTRQGSDGFQGSLHPCAVDKSSLRIERVNSQEVAIRVVFDEFLITVLPPIVRLRHQTYSITHHLV